MEFPQAVGDPKASYLITSHSVTLPSLLYPEWEPSHKQSWIRKLESGLYLVLLPGMVALLLPDLISSWAKPMNQHWTDVRPCGPWDRPSGAAASKVSPMITLAVRNCCLGRGAGRTFVKSVQVLLNKEMEIRVPGDW